MTLQISRKLMEEMDEEKEKENGDRRSIESSLYLTRHMCM